MSYEQELTFALRVKGFTDNEIVDALEELDRYTQKSGVPPEENFGPAREYAQQFPMKSRKRPRSRLLVVGTIVALAYAVFVFVAEPVFAIDIAAIVGGFTLWPALVILAISVFGSFYLSWLRPAKRR